jgi:hypothetical protein
VSKVRDEASKLQQGIVTAGDAIQAGENKEFGVTGLQEEVANVVVLLNTVVDTVVSKGFFTMPEISTEKIIPEELQEVIDLCSGSVKDMVKEIQDKAQDELMRLGYSAAEQLQVDAVMDHMELEETSELLHSVAAFVASKVKKSAKVQKKHCWRVRERAVYWTTLLALPPDHTKKKTTVQKQKQKHKERRGDFHEGLKRAIQGSLTTRKALEADPRVLKIADSQEFVAGLRSLMSEVWVDQEAAVKEELDGGLAMCNKLKESYDKEASPKKREALLQLYKQSCEKLKSAASNMGGMQSGSLQISFLADLSESVMQLQATMKQMQAQLHNIEQGLLLLTGQPVAQVIRCVGSKCSKCRQFSRSIHCLTCSDLLSSLSPLGSHLQASTASENFVPTSCHRKCTYRLMEFARASTDAIRSRWRRAKTPHWISRSSW